MSILAKITAYVQAHADHFLISLGVSLAVTVLTNVLMHYLPALMHLLHLPAKLIRLLTQQ